MPDHAPSTTSAPDAPSSRVVFTLWSWDRISMAGIHALGRAATHGDELLVGVVDDVTLGELQGAAPLIDADDRVEIVQRLRMVSDVVRVDGALLRDPARLGPWLRGHDVTVVAGGLTAADDGAPRTLENLMLCSALDADLPIVAVGRTGTRTDPAQPVTLSA